ncbi:hypothetical protein [Rhizobium sp. BK176]|uniref:hypothetical protein n=1 Tax=Rhizobium sp. BK176 TaxID=2587071 RepID=UPI002169E5CB|nr:hypothetical protein [Rhizobium sp. BK176]MCS4088753.1 hypothetical protein [Rhizobium sp. BK176]
MTDRFDFPYSLVDGELFRTDSKGNRKRLCHRGGSVALAYDTEDGVLHHHGEYNDVSKWFDETRAKLSKSPSTIGLADALTLVSMPLEDECVQEVNRCIAVTGSVMGIEKRLSPLYGFGAPGTGTSSTFGSNRESV